jgi:hypothetical protein
MIISEKADFRFPKDDHAQEHEPEISIPRFPERSVLKQSRPAAIRPLGGGKMPLTTREDGRHPKFEDHGRIAGC